MNQDPRQLHQLFKIGSARAGNALANLGEPLDALLPLDAGAVEARLWLAMGALDLWQRSGFQPAPAADEAIAPAPAERLRPCPARAEALFAQLLRGAHPAGLLSEWLQLLHQHGAHLPARFLPNMLETAARQPRLRAVVAPVLGERGHWLAQRQAQWAWAAAQSDPAQRALLWETGSLDQRGTALREWRADDPAGARQALMDAWTAEPPEHRAALLPALAVRLGLDDEAWLESALDDRRKEVRAAAQRLLAQLPGSQLSQRMLARLQPLLQLERRLLRASRLQLALPAECDAAMRRDGTGANAWPGLGEKAGWVVDMLSAVDPGAWSERFERTPRELLALAGDSEFGAALIRGWAQATVRHAADGSMPWLLGFAHWWTAAKPALRGEVPDSLFEVLGAACRHDEQGGLSALVDAFPAHWERDAGLVHLLHTLADAGAGSWPPLLSRRVLQRVEAALPALPSLANAWSFRQLLSSLALALDPATAVAASGNWHSVVQSENQWRDAFDTFFSIVRFRHEMILSFQEPA
jgi:hypothetical protein